MKQEILVKLRSAEDDTSKRVVGAKERAADLVKQARTDAVRVLEKAEAEARKDDETRIAAERKRLEAERTKIFEQGKKQEDAARAAYAKKADTHAQKAVAAFERNL